ncbi:MAG: helix-turn-helix transcriptional regulator [Lachnospiraceae bacterium]|nr:helix-turn-helix transcriptional regulator [Lachnospiraceae bacterium]
MRNLTQEDLAGIMGVKRPNISRFETGQYNPSLDMLVKMAECMDLEIEVTLINKREGIRNNEEE